ncbi:MAG: hypothetical protein RLZZ214_3387 [Verrucomicrobiota bacterium]|jgi:hypothetical protein
MKTISALMFQTPFGFTSRRLQASTPNTRRTCRLRIRASLLMSCLLATASTQPVAAELPALQDQPWLGYYAVYADKNYEFKITAADGTVTLIPVGEGAPVLGNLLVYIKFGIEETLPDGKIVSNPVLADTLETADPALDKLGKCILRGKTAGNASLEITIEQSRGIVFVGSRVLDPSTLTNPIRCFVTAVFPNVNPPAMAANNPEEVNERDAKRAAKKEAKAAEDKLKGDSVDLKWTDGKRQKLTFEKVLDAGSKEINGPGIAAAEIKIAAYGKRKFFVTAAPNSAMKLSNAKPASLSEGFSIQWSPDHDKDKDGKARLALEVK